MEKSKSIIKIYLKYRILIGDIRKEVLSERGDKS